MKVEHDVETVGAGEHSPERILAIDAALTRLARTEPRQARIVELRFFTGMTDEEVAGLLGISSRTVKRDWAAAKAWLYTALADSSTAHDRPAPRERLSRAASVRGLATASARLPLPAG